MRYLICFLFFVLVSPSVHAQVGYSAIVYDAVSKAPIPFATIKYDEGHNGTIADLNGFFELDKTMVAGIKQIEISCVGYEAQKMAIPLNVSKVYLKPRDNALAEVTVKPQYEKIYHVINTTIANKKRNNPDLYDWYRCKVYYKMVLDAFLPNTDIRATDDELKEFREFTDNQYLLMSETYSRRTWKHPQHLQEDVIGSRFIGFKKSMFTDLVTDILPFHAYSDYISLNGKDYHNPLSNGYRQHYKFNLSEELLQGRDTLWIISFSPNKHNDNELKGKVSISSNGYAIASFEAKAIDTNLKRDILIQQQYQFIPDSVAGHWFPAQLNYIINLRFKGKRREIDYNLKGNSLIDSVTFNEDRSFRFDKQHTVRLMKNADELPDSVWKQMRPVELDKKESRTYVVLDSIGEKKHFDRGVSYFSKLPVGKVPVSIFDIELKRLFSANYYEGYRFDLGLQTNERLLKFASVGGWGGYGINDKRWKYGAFTEFYLDRNREFIIRAGYEMDLSDPGRVHLSRELDKNYLKSYLLRRVDEVTETSLSVKKKLGYCTIEVTGRQQTIAPKYDYALEVDGKDFNSFAAREVSVNLKYAYAERTAPLFGYYLKVSSKYPVVYGKLTYGSLESGELRVPYTQAVAAITWQKHFNRLGKEHFFAEGGKLWSDKSMPLSKLFAGNGFRNSQQSIYVFGGMMTMLPYEYYTDQFINIVLRHEFDWKLFNAVVPKSGVSFTPVIALQYGVLYGTLQKPQVQKYVTFGVPDNAYNEGGAMLNGLIRLKYLNTYYFTFNLGYFYHFTDVPDMAKNGRLVYSIGAEF